MRWIIRIISILAVSALVVIGLIFLLPAEKIGALASVQLEKATGRKLELSGEFKPTIYPVFGIKTGPLTISNAKWASHPHMVSAQGLSVGIGFSSLFRGDIKIQQLVLDTPEINLERSPNGVGNWQFANASVSTQTSRDVATSVSPPSLGMGLITNGSVAYTDAITGQSVTIRDIDLDFSLKEIGTAHLAGSAMWKGRNANIDILVSEYENLLKGKTSDLKGSIATNDLNVSLSGGITLSEEALPFFDGQYTVDFPDMKAVSELAGVDFPEPLNAAQNISSNGKIMMLETGIRMFGTADVLLNKLPINAEYEINGPKNWAKTLRVDANLHATGRDAFTFTWAGLVNGRTGNADGTVNIESSDFPKTMAAFGQNIEFPKGTGRKAGANGVVRVRDGKNKISNATFSLDQNNFHGDAEIVFGDVPHIIANLKAGSLDLSNFTSSENAGVSRNSSSAGSGWSKEVIQIAGLDAINADINLDATSVDLGVSQLGKTNVDAKLSSGTLALNLRDVRAYDGIITGLVRFKGGNAVSFSSDIKADGVQLEPLLGRLLDINKLTGRGNTVLKLSSTGGSLHQIMHSLSGTGTMRVDHGTIKGVDLAAMMRNVKHAFGGFEGATEFTSLTGTFTMEKGVLQNVDMLLSSPLFTATGKGQVNVGEQNMSYRVTPSTLSKGAKFSVPIDITGPWNNLSFKPDLSGLIDLLTQGRLEEEKVALKVKAEAKLREKLKLEADQALSKNTLEATAKQKLEDKVKENVGDLLKGLFD